MATRESERKSRKRKKDELEDEEEGVAPARRRSKVSSSGAEYDDTEMEIAEMSQIAPDPGLRESVHVGLENDCN